MSEDRIERAALGRIYDIGALYDARSDSFCGISLFKRTVTPSAVTTTDNNHTDMKYIIGDNLSDKFSKLDVSAELSISVLCGLLQMDGSAKYLDTRKESKRSGQASLVYNFMTKVERLNIFSEELKECVSHEALSHEHATHVVVDVYWGANSLITVNDENRNKENKTEIEGRLSATLTKACLKISGKADLEFEESEKAWSRNYSLQVFGDVLTDKSVPSTIEDAIKMMQQIPALVQTANDGKGKPLKYGLFPLSAKSFRTHVQVQQTPSVMLRYLENYVIDSFVNIFNEIAQHTQEVNDFISDIEEMENTFKCVPPGTTKPLKELRRKTRLSESQLRGKLSTVLTSFRSGNGDTSALESLIVEYRSSEDSAEKLRDDCREKYRSLEPKRDLVKRCQRNSVTYLTSMKDDLVDIGEVVVFYGNTEIAKTDEERWAQNRKVFFNLADENQNKRKGTAAAAAGGSPVTLFYYVDCDFDPDIAERKGIRIERYKDGECVDGDVAFPVHVPRVVNTFPEAHGRVPGWTPRMDPELYLRNAQRDKKRRNK